MERRWTAIPRVTIIACIVTFLTACSSDTTTPNDRSVEGNSSIMDVKGASAQGSFGTGSTLIVIDDKAGTVTPGTISVNFTDYVGVVLLGHGKLNVKRVDASTPLLAGAPPTRITPHIASLLLNTSPGERVWNQPYYDYRIFDHNGDGYDDLLLAFRAFDMVSAGPSSQYILEVDNDGKVYSIPSNVNVPWAGTYWPTLRRSIGNADHLVALRWDAGEYSPSSVVMLPGETIAIVAFSAPDGLNAESVATSTLCNAPEQHVGFYDKNNKAAGRSYHQKHTAVVGSNFEDPTEPYVFHFEVDKMSGPEDNAFKVEIDGVHTGFFTKYRQQAKGTAVELTFGK
jgi:hypothetical protein